MYITILEETYSPGIKIDLFARHQNQKTSRANTASPICVTRRQWEFLLVGLLVGISLGGLVRGPQGEVVAEELHDEGRVLVGLLVEGVELGDGIVEGLLGDVAGAVGAVEDLVVEDGEVEGKAEAMPEAAW